MTTPPHTQDRHAALLRGVAELAVLVGSEGLTVRGVCRHVGVSARTFYDHFPDVRSALARACSAAERELRARTEDAFRRSAGRPARARLEATVGEALRFLAEDPVRAEALMLQSAGAGPAAGLARVRAWNWAADLLLRAVEDRATPAIGRRLAMHLAVGGIHERVLDAVWRGATDELPAFAPELADVVLRGYAPVRASVAAD